MAIFFEHLLYTRHYPRRFTCTTLYNSLNDSIIIIQVTYKETEAKRSEFLAHFTQLISIWNAYVKNYFQNEIIGGKKLNKLLKQTKCKETKLKRTESYQV